MIFPTNHLTGTSKSGNQVTAQKPDYTYKERPTHSTKTERIVKQACFMPWLHVI